jgi:hypothetical protein
LDKSVAFFVIEPFNGSILQFCHGVVPLLKYGESKQGGVFRSNGEVLKKSHGTHER